MPVPKELLCLVLVVLLALTQGLMLGVAKGAPRAALSMHFEEATGARTLPTDALPRERYVATNRFKVRSNAMAKFEKRWAERKSRLAVLNGFRFFALFRRVYPFSKPEGQQSDDNNYVSLTIWEDKESFDAWRTGEAFKEAHGGGGITDFIKLLSTALFILKGSPQPAFYDGLLVQPGEKLDFFTDAGWRSVQADGVTLLPTDVFMAQNRFAVPPQNAAAFEQRWAARESYLSTIPGFVGFSMLRRDAEKADDGFNYMSTTLWRSQQAFDQWRQSDQFKAAHAAAGQQPKLYEGSPSLAFYEGTLALSSAKGV
eukprot:gene29469-35569_t